MYGFYTRAKRQFWMLLNYITTNENSGDELSSRPKIWEHKRLLINLINTATIHLLKAQKTK